MATIIFTKTLTLSVIECASCGIPFGITEDFEERRRNNHTGFYCPNGHSNYYAGKSEAEKLRDELKRKEQELADTAIQKINLQNQLAEKERKLKRVHNGVCPCCNRSFVNLQKHMKTKHPEIIKK